MRALNKNYVYDLSELTNNEKSQLLDRLIELDDTWDDDVAKEDLFSNKYLYFTNSYNSLGEWLVSDEIHIYTGIGIVNAKELFYTLENIQVDCRGLSEEQIKEMADIFENNGFIIGNLAIFGKYYFLSHLRYRCCTTNIYDEKKTTITYEKFMELFGAKYEVTMIAEKPQEFKDLVKVLNEELTEEAYKEKANKLNYELDFNFITQLAERMNANKGKYEPYNWQRLDNIEDLKQALFRHVMEVMKGNFEDDNRPHGHLEAIALNCMFINYQLNGK